MTQLSNNDFDRVFRERLGDLSSTPSGLNWVNIESQLGSRKSASTVWKRWSLAALLLLISSAGAGGWWMYYQERAHNQSLQAQLTQPHTIEGHTSHQAAVVAGTYNKATTSGSTGSETTGTATVAHAVRQVPSPASGTTDAPIVPASEATFSHPVPDKASAHGFTAFAHNSGLKAPDRWYYLPDGTINEIAVSGMRIGPVVQYGLNGLVGGVQQQLVAQKGYSASPTMGVAYGISFENDFNSRIGFELQWQVSSAEGQMNARSPSEGFRSSSDGEEHFNTRLNYFRMPLVIKYRVPVAGKPWQAPRVWNLSAGVSYGRLNWVNLDDAPATLQPRHFNTNELGVVAGISHDWYLGRNYIASLGLRSGWSNHPGSLPALWNTGTHPGNYFIALQAKIQLLIPPRQSNLSH